MSDTERDRLILDGEVIESSNSKFKVKVNEHHLVLATLSGKMRINLVKILVGDRVSVEVSPYDVSQGRIVYRHKS
jgi:translation initiation factor IF-1